VREREREREREGEVCVWGLFADENMKRPQGYSFNLQFGMSDHVEDS
jgi:hypothetical protein